MSAPRLQVAAERPEPEAGAEAPQPGSFRIVSRIVDWITNDRTQLLNITERVNEIVRRSGVTNGIVHLQSLHTTTAIFLNEWQDALLEDVKTFFD
ncbi:MAG TPA: YjbQ family protein, partial [Bryobacteraceae bacterium]|nr:YjbQ family protein [Bryobacteraceae bacterium]